MRAPCRTRAAALLALFAAGLASCGTGAPAAQCARDRDCPAGQGCLAGGCVALPCGGACQANETCDSSGSVCLRKCTLDRDCDQGSVCNPQLGSCAQCTFDSQCDGVAGRPRCDSAHGICVACNADLDCVRAQGPGHFCDAHACKPGCKADADCNASASPPEKCEGAGAAGPGQCVQCMKDADCTSPGTGVCDPFLHRCVQCGGNTQQQADASCHPGEKCDLRTNLCARCLAADNASAADCGYGSGGQSDSRTCDPTDTCVRGCQSDAQCACPPESPGCARNPDQLHCDPALHTVPGTSMATYGACVQCMGNRDCAYEVRGSPQGGALNGARCVQLPAGDPRAGAHVCQEGCDQDADCPAGRPCHLGPPGDPNNNKCAECACAAGTTEPFCQDKRCGPTAQGFPRVCDAQTLTCRLKRSGELCHASNECGDLRDPALSGNAALCLPAGLCVFSWHSGVQTPAPTYYCPPDPPGTAAGRCAVPCDSFPDQTCAGPGTRCPAGTACVQATGEPANRTGAYCVPNATCSCSSPGGGCPR